MGHRHHRARHVVDEGDAPVVGEQPEGDQHVVDDPLGLEQHDPRRGPDEQRRPEGQEDEPEQQPGPPRRRVGDEVSDGVAEQQAQRGDAEAHDEGAPQQGHVDAALGRLAGDGPVGQALQIDGVQVVAGGEAVAGGADGLPGRGVAPAVVDLQHGRAPRPPGEVLQPARAAHDDAPQAAAHPVDAARHAADGPFLARAQQLARGRRVRRLARIGPPVPVAQRREGVGQGVGDHRVVDAAHEHRRQRHHERDADEGDEGQGQPGRAESGSGHRASHALKRSFISSMWSLHHAQSFCSARLVFAGQAGMCGFMSMPVSAWVETRGAPERRAGL